jgi:hypothetical protein
MVMLIAARGKPSLRRGDGTSVSSFMNGRQMQKIGLALMALGEGLG